MQEWFLASLKLRVYPVEIDSLKFGKCHLMLDDFIEDLLVYAGDFLDYSVPLVIVKITHK